LLDDALLKSSLFIHAWAADDCESPRHDQVQAVVGPDAQLDWSVDAHCIRQRGIVIRQSLHSGCPALQIVITRSTHVPLGTLCLVCINRGQLGEGDAREICLQ
jgi:hypothetical protein